MFTVPSNWDVYKESSTEPGVRWTNAGLGVKWAYTLLFQSNFIGTQPCIHLHIICGCFLPQGQNQVLVRKTTWSANSKIFTIYREQLSSLSPVNTHTLCPRESGKTPLKGLLIASCLVSVVSVKSTYVLTNFVSKESHLHALISIFIYVTPVYSIHNWCWLMRLFKIISIQELELFLLKHQMGHAQL